MFLCFYQKDSDIIKKYIVGKTTAYINYLNEVSPEDEENKTNINVKSINEKSKGSKSSRSSFSNSKDQENSKSDLADKKNDKDDKNNDILVVSNNVNNSKTLLNRHTIKNKLKDLNSIVNQGKTKTNFYDATPKVDFNEYLAPNIDDQEFEDIILEDKRTFKEFFLETLNENQLFMNTFNVKDNFRPTSVKLTFFILNMILCCVINAFFIGEDIISEIYHIEGNDPFFGFVPRAISRYLYSFVVGYVVTVVVDLFFVQEKKMKIIFSREKKKYCKFEG